jgi:hypothetical protein
MCLYLCDFLCVCLGGAGYVFSREMMIQFMPHYHECMVHECGRVAEVLISYSLILILLN